MTGHKQKVALCWGSKPPAYSIGLEEDLIHDQDSGFVILFDDAPDPDDARGCKERLVWVCLHCLIEDYPELGRGLDLAKEFGAADLEGGEWRGRCSRGDTA